MEINRDTYTSVSAMYVLTMLLPSCMPCIHCHAVFTFNSPYQSKQK